MTKSGCTCEQIIEFLKQVEGGAPVKDRCRQHDFSDATFYVAKPPERLGCFGGATITRVRVGAD
jgi:putative transposase